ncbi:8044_t:CDS:2, partial [Cetraspora pellucida]
FDIELDDNTLAKVNHNMKFLVKLIVDEIEEDSQLNLTYQYAILMLVHSTFYALMTKKVKIKFSHDIHHKKLIDVTTPEEIKCEIMQNLYMDPIQLRTHLCQKFYTLQVTPKQINYWWSVFNQCFFKLDEDPVTSAHRFLENSHSDSEFCYE